ncbi:MAG: gluconate 2-dehydrogenase subunit 3 family protein [Alphaproteobacteria bacterium]|jgi:hypothetical protein
MTESVPAQTVPRDGHKLTDEQWFTLRALADAIVPASTKYDVPGAGDEAVCKEIISDAGRRLPRLIEALATLNTMAADAHGGGFTSLEPAQQGEVAQAFKEAHGDAATYVGALTVQCYYRDERIMASLGIEARPPAPIGYKMEQGDWSLLDVVRKRPAFHRPAG